MGRKVYLNDEQFKSYVKSVLKEGFHRTANTRTFGQKIREYVIPAERTLQANGMSLFQDTNTLNELDDIADAIDNKEITVKDFLDPDNFADDEAYQLVLQYLKNIRYSGDNKYAQALANNNKDSMLQAAEDRERQKEANLSDRQKIINQKVAAKKQRQEEFISSMQADAVPELSKVNAMCQKLEDTYLVGNTVYMFVGIKNKQASPSDAQVSAIKRLRLSIKNIGLTISPAMLRMDKARQIAYIYFNIG
jgi:hypothetical protein